MLMVYMLYLKLALIELALFKIVDRLESLRVLRILRYTPRRGWNYSYTSNNNLVITNSNCND